MIFPFVFFVALVDRNSGSRRHPGRSVCASVNEIYGRSPVIPDTEMHSPLSVFRHYFHALVIIRSLHFIVVSEQSKSHIELNAPFWICDRSFRQIFARRTYHKVTRRKDAPKTKKARAIARALH
jgi:hypothetical protein